MVYAVLMCIFPVAAFGTYEEKDKGDAWGLVLGIFLRRFVELCAYATIGFMVFHFISKYW